MGAVVSSLGFNQPFLLALLGIIIMLSATVALVSGDPPDEYYDYAVPQIRVAAPANSSFAAASARRQAFFAATSAKDRKLV